MDELRLSLLALFVAVIAGIYLFDTLRKRGAARPQAQPPQAFTEAGPGRNDRADVAGAESAGAEQMDADPTQPQGRQSPGGDLYDARPGATDPEDVYPEDAFPDDALPEDALPEDALPEDAYPEDAYLGGTAADGTRADAAGPGRHEVHEPEAEGRRDIPLGDIDLLRADASQEIDLDGPRDDDGAALSDVLGALDEQPFNEDRLMEHSRAEAAREDEPFAQGQLDLDGNSSRREPRLEADVAAAARGDELIVVLHVMRPDRSLMRGGMVQAALGTAQLELGEMSIYHHYGLTFSGAHQPVFSVARAVEPGTFDAQDERTYDTPGLTLFMRLPGPQDGAVVLELMFNTAQTLARDLEASVLDDRRTPLSAQALNHLRDKVAEFSRRQKLVTS